MNDYLSKPFEATQLLSILKRCTEGVTKAK